MRLWTVHPKYLDTRGLGALWREALLAQRVLQGKTRGYVHHPQLTRFQQQSNPLNCIATYLTGIYADSLERKYNFQADKIGAINSDCVINETDGQLQYEWNHLLNKLKIRSPVLFNQFESVKHPEPHSLFRIIRGSVRDWEKTY